MRRFLLSIVLSLITSIVYANNVEVIYKGPRYIGDWETIELSSIKFHDLEIGDTIYVYATKTDSTSLGAFQNHKWDTLEDAMNGDVTLSECGNSETVTEKDVKAWQKPCALSGKQFSGQFLMEVGVEIPLDWDYASRVFELRR